MPEMDQFFMIIENYEMTIEQLAVRQFFFSLHHFDYSSVFSFPRLARLCNIYPLFLMGGYLGMTNSSFVCVQKALSRIGRTIYSQSPLLDVWENETLRRWEKGENLFWRSQTWSLSNFLPKWVVLSNVAAYTSPKGTPHRGASDPVLLSALFQWPSYCSIFAMAQSLVDTIKPFLTPCNYAWAILLDGGKGKISSDIMDRTRIFEELRKSNSSLAMWVVSSLCLIT